MKESFIERRFTKKNQVMIDLVNTILAEYAGDGFRLSLRQLYYQLVARGIVANKMSEYKKLSDLVDNARLAGLVDWDMIEDRNRETVAVAHWATPADILEAAERSFAVDKWENQPNHVEVIVEKDALSGVLIPVCRDLDIRFTATKGYGSASLFYEMGQRLLEAYRRGKRVVIIHLADHDPSGLDMTRDADRRLGLLSRVEVDVVRIALNLDQVRALNPPPNPAKTADPRFAEYKRRFGTASWELDAIDPRRLGDLVRDTVIGFRDDALWDEAVRREDQMKAELRDVVAQMNDRANGDKNE